MECDLDTPEFNSMLAILLDDLASGEFAENQQLSSSAGFDTPSGNISFDTRSIGNETKKYILTRVEMNATEFEKKKLEKKVWLAKSSKSMLGKPKMIKSDIRSSYSQMMSNVYNSLDLQTILGMFQTYAMPDMKFRLKKRHPLTNQMTAVHLSGPLNVSNLLYCNMMICPDCVTKLLSSKYDPASGVVTCHFQFTMTKVFNVTSIHQVLPNLLVESVHANGTEDSTAGVSDVQIVETFENLKNSLPLRKNPVNVIHNVKLTIVTNADKRMCEMRASMHVIENDFNIEA